jgi:ketosteroid isomerase-like protein
MLSNRFGNSTRSRPEKRPGKGRETLPFPTHGVGIRRRNGMKARLQVVSERGGRNPESPESIHEMFEKHVNEGNLEGLAHLYEADAVLVERDGKEVSGSGAIVEFLRGLLSAGPRIRIRHMKTIDAGNVAVLLSEWQMDCTAPDGSRRGVSFPSCLFIPPEGNTFP